MNPDEAEDITKDTKPKTKYEKEKEKINKFLESDAKKYEKEDPDAVFDVIKENKWKKWREEWKENPE